MTENLCGCDGPRFPHPWGSEDCQHPEPEPDDRRGEDGRMSIVPAEGNSTDDPRWIRVETRDGSAEVEIAADGRTLTVEVSVAELVRALGGSA